MRIIWAVARQTMRACLRSRVVIVLLGLNLLAVFLLPVTVAGDGTAAGEIQVAMIYSLRAVTALVSLAALWLGCAGLSREIEAYNIHLVLTKPAPPWAVWCGKWLGILSMTGTVFVISSAVIYGLVLWRVRNGDFPAEDIRRVKAEILVGRRACRSEPINFRELAKAEYLRRQKAGELAPDHVPEAVISELERQVKAQSTEVPAGASRPWPFENLSFSSDNELVNCRYRLYLGSQNVSDQRDTVGRWAIVNPDAAAKEDQVTVSPPFKVMTGSFHEFAFPSRLVSPQGRVLIVYENMDLEGSPVVFQPDDGPTLLISSAGFTSNWCRGTLVGLLRLALLAAVGCVFGGAFSTPVAIFVGFAYLLAGAALDPQLGAPMRDVAGNVTAWKAKDMLSFVASQLVRIMVVTFRDFDVTHHLARGYLISGVQMAKLFFFNGLLRAGPLVALGVWIFSRRELGKVIHR